MQIETLTAPPAKKRRPVRLDIAGGDLLLRGTFEQWLPVAMERPGDGDGSVQLLVDVTSLKNAPGTAALGTDVLSFTAHDVKAVGPLTYAVNGKLTAGRAHKDLQIILQTPGLHTPFCLLTFSLPAREFAPLWRAFEARFAPADEGGTREVRARAWLRVPEVATA